MLPNVGAGVYYSSSKLFAGLSVPSFLSYAKTGSGSVQAFHSFNNYDFIFSGGGLITFSPFFKFKPSVLINYSLNSTRKLTQLDLNGNIILADMLWIGGSWRTTEQVAVGILQFQVNPQMMFGLSYDYAAGRMKSFNTGGSTEFILRYEFGYRVSASNPRYF
jgi:type IX secretion system PorP/SprF family membrane protein